jgi:hypothetical protein
METEIKHTVTKLKAGFAIVWGMAVLIFVLGETNVIPNGLYADNDRTTYIFETISILLTATMLPISLKFFSIVLLKKVNEQSLPIALKSYYKFSNVRMLMLSLIILMGFICYYLTLSKTGGLCALIGLTGTLFCVPGEERTRRELHIYKEEK